MNKKKEVKKTTAKGQGAVKGTKPQVERLLTLVDSAIETAEDSGKKRFLEQLNEMEEKVRKTGGKDLDRLISEISLRKGRCARGIHEKNSEYRFWKQAYDYAKKSGNAEVIVQAGLELGFDFYEFTSSIKEVSELHMSCIGAICAQGDAIHTRLRIMGINLYNFWRQIEFRRLSESDLKAKQMVVDSAKSLEKAEFDEDMAAPVMIMLLSRAFDFTDPALEWAQLETLMLDAQIPPDVKKRLGNMGMPPIP